MLLSIFLTVTVGFTATIGFMMWQWMAQQEVLAKKHIRQIAEVQALQVSKQLDSALTAARDMGNSALALREAGVLTNYETPKRPVVHVFFIAPGCCYTGYSYSNNNSPFYMGIPRLKFPSDAPSRSTLKLEEAFHVFIPADEWDERLANGMYAVDLGACPGGWTYQLVKRNMWVSSVDNGPMAQSLMDTGQVTWLREDGFRYRPNRNNISWMVCDMVEKPAKVAALMAQWLVNGWCRETIFNLKLPMKKRYEEVSQNLAYIQAQLDEHGVNAQIQARQLYHDREEVTVHIRRWWAAVGGRRDER